MLDVVGTDRDHLAVVIAVLMALIAPLAALGRAAVVRWGPLARPAYLPALALTVGLFTFVPGRQDHGGRARELDGVAGMSGVGEIFTGVAIAGLVAIFATGWFWWLAFDSLDGDPARDDQRRPTRRWVLVALYVVTWIGLVAGCAVVVDPA